MRQSAYTLQNTLKIHRHKKFSQICLEYVLIPHCWHEQWILQQGAGSMTTCEHMLLLWSINGMRSNFHSGGIQIRPKAVIRSGERDTCMNCCSRILVLGF